MQSTQSTSTLQLNSAIDDASFLLDIGESNIPSTSMTGKRLRRKVSTPLASSPDTSQSTNLKQMPVEALQSMQSQTKRNPNTALCEYMAIELENLPPEKGALARSEIRRAFNDIIDQVSLMTSSREKLPQQVLVQQYGEDSNELLFISTRATTDRATNNETNINHSSDESN